MPVFLLKVGGTGILPVPERLGAVIRREARHFLTIQFYSP
jgi:hypothetical protein